MLMIDDCNLFTRPTETESEETRLLLFHCEELLYYIFTGLAYWYLKDNMIPITHQD